MATHGRVAGTQWKGIALEEKLINVGIFINSVSSKEGFMNFAAQKRMHIRNGWTFKWAHVQCTSYYTIVLEQEKLGASFPLFEL